MNQEFIQQVKDTVKDALREVHTAIPGKIESFDPNTGLATVLPSMKYKCPDGTMLDYPHITGVPVLFPQGAGQGVTVAFPVKAGDSCLIIAAEQSIDFWMYGKETDTDLAHDLTNAICIPGLFAKANAAVKRACEIGGVVVDAGGTSLVVQKGSVAVNGSLTVSGSLSVGGSITAKGGVSGGGVSLGGHTHTDSEGGRTSAPNT